MLFLRRRRLKERTAIPFISKLVESIGRLTIPERTLRGIVEHGRVIDHFLRIGVLKWRLRLVEDWLLRNIGSLGWKVGVCLVDFIERRRLILNLLILHGQLLFSFEFMLSSFEFPEILSSIEIGKTFIVEALKQHTFL